MLEVAESKQHSISAFVNSVYARTSLGGRCPRDLLARRPLHVQKRQNFPEIFSPVRTQYFLEVGSEELLVGRTGITG